MSCDTCEEYEDLVGLLDARLEDHKDAGEAIILEPADAERLRDRLKADWDHHVDASVNY